MQEQQQGSELKDQSFMPGGKLAGHEKTADGYSGICTGARCDSAIPEQPAVCAGLIVCILTPQLIQGDDMELNFDAGRKIPPVANKGQL